MVDTRNTLHTRRQPLYADLKDTIVGSPYELRIAYAGIVALALVVIITMPTLASAPFIGGPYIFGDMSRRFILVLGGEYGDNGRGVSNWQWSGGFWITRGGVLLCSGVGAQISSGGILSITSSSSFGSNDYVTCQAGVFKTVRGGGPVGGIVTVILIGGVPPILILQMAQAWAPVVVFS